MSESPSLEEVKLLVENRIRELESDPDSLLRHVDVKRFPFVHSPGFDGQPSPHGQWVENPGSTTIKVFRLIGQLGESLCGPYGDLKGAPKRAVTSKRVKRIKAKFTVKIPGESELSIPLRKKLERERDPSYIPAGEGRGRVEVNSLVRKVPGNMTEITLSSPPMWKKLEQNGPCVEPLFDDEDEWDDLEDIGLKPIIQTLATWPDPELMFTELKNKSQYILNTDMDMLDEFGNHVYPDRFEQVYAPGVTVVVDVVPQLWDFSVEEKKEPVKSPAKRGEKVAFEEDDKTERSQKLQRTYVLNIVQMQALHAPVKEETAVPVDPPKRERSPSPVQELMPARKRPFMGITEASGSSTLSDDLGLIDWAPSDIEGETRPDPANEEHATVSGKKSTRAGKQAKGKGKEKEKAAEDVTMEDD